MSADYWLGLLTPVAAAVIAVVIAVAWRLVVKIAELTVSRYANAAEDRRALLGAITYSTKRVWLFGCGNLGFAIFAGQDSKGRLEAYNRLHQPRSLADIRAAAKPARRDDA